MPLPDALKKLLNPKQGQNPTNFDHTYELLDCPTPPILCIIPDALKKSCNPQDCKCTLLHSHLLHGGLIPISSIAACIYMFYDHMHACTCYWFNSAPLDYCTTCQNTFQLGCCQLWFLGALWGSKAYPSPTSGPRILECNNDALRKSMTPRDYVCVKLLHHYKDAAS